MKITIFLFLSLGILALPAAQGEKETREDVPGKTRGFLGVSLDRVSDALRYHLKLDDEVGVMIVNVVHESAAKKAGLHRYDIITQVDDQIIVNPEQLATIIRNRHAGDEVSLRVIREGKILTNAATLAKLPVQHETKNNPRHRGPTQGWFKMLEKPYKNLEKNKKILENKAREMIERLRSLEKGRHGRVIIDIPELQVTTRNGYRVKYQVKNGKKELYVRDWKGNVIYDGPVRTAKDLESTPQEVRDQFEELEMILDLPRHGKH